MKRIAALLLLVTIAASLAGCGAQSAAETPEPAPSAAPEPTAEPSPEPDEALPETLELSFGVPSAADSPFGLQYYVNRSPELGCAFAYPDFCSAETDGSVVQLSPARFFARIFLYAYPKGAEGSPQAPGELLDPRKWGEEPRDCTVGGRFAALEMDNLKYDTYRRWIVWETDGMIYQLYAACFDDRIDTINETLDAVASSFCPASELSLPDAEGRRLLRSFGSVELYCSGAELSSDGGALELWLMLEIENGSDEELSFITEDLSADGRRLSGVGRCSVPAGGSAVWPVSLPVTAEGEPISELSVVIAALGGDGPIDELALPVVLRFTHPEG